MAEPIEDEAQQQQQQPQPPQQQQHDHQKEAASAATPQTETTAAAAPEQGRQPQQPQQQQQQEEQLEQEQQQQQQQQQQEEEAPPPLSPTELAAYARDGLVLLRRAFSPAVAAACRERLWAVMEGGGAGIVRGDPATWPVKFPLALVFEEGHGEVGCGGEMGEEGLR